jgi:DNA polymerase I-like protein with 3'-5' exonuclease and polymerase domains
METKYKIITNKQELKKLIQCCKQTGYASVDFETNAEPLYNKSFKPTILSVTFQPGFGCSIPLDHFETKKYTSSGWNWKKMLRKFGEEIIENPEVVKVAWNYKFDDQIFQKYNIYYRGVCLDGMLAKYLLNEEKPNDLKSMVRRYLPEYGDYEKQDKFDKIPWDKKEMEPLCHYGCQDTDYTLRLMLFFEKKLIDLGLYNTYRNLIMTASRVLTSVEKNGLYVDRAFNQELLDSYLPKIEAAKEAIYNLPKVKKFTKLYNQSKIEKYIAKLEEEIENLDPRVDKRKIQSREQKIANIRAGVFTTKKELELIRPVSLGSSVDLPQLMYSEEGFNFEVIKKNDSGKPSTDEETLTNLRLIVKKPDSPKAVFLDSLLELRGLEKMYKTYIEGWHEKIQDDDRLHGRFLIHGTTSGRLSCISGDSLVLTNYGEIPIRELEYFSDEDDIKVMTQEGWKPLVDFIYKGEQEMYEVTLEDGTSIRCTLDHKFITNQGTKSLRSIYNSSRKTISNKIKLLRYVEEQG